MTLDPSARLVNAPFRKPGGDVWLRARTNALAHKLAAESYERWSVAMGSAMAALTVIPIVTVAMSLHLVSTGVGLHSAPPLGRTYETLGLIAILANSLALLAGLLSKELRFSEKASQHRTLLSGYSIIAQKARRLDSEEMDPQEAKHLLRNLQETFEIYKSSSYEPNHKTFSKAQRIVKELKPLPFGLTSD